LKDEILGKAFSIAPKCLIQCFRADAIELRKIGIEHYLFVANEEY